MSKSNIYKRYRANYSSCLPEITAFILVCMVIIYSVESLGLGNREKNVEFMITTLEKSKKFYFISILVPISHVDQRNAIQTYINPTESQINNQFVFESLVKSSLKEEKLDKIRKILYMSVNKIR